MVSRQVQEPLSLRVDDRGRFDTFVVAKDNAWFVDSIKMALAADCHEFFYVFGPSGCGKTHLLTALIHETHVKGQAGCYLDLQAARAIAPEPLYYVNSPLVIVDNADGIACDAEWELAFFALYNRWQDSEGGIMLVSARTGPAAVNFMRRDLNTRMASGICCQLASLSEEECVQALLLKARRRGLTLQRGVLDFLVSRCCYDMGRMTAVLDRLDRASLCERHGITIPFAKKVLGL